MPASLSACSSRSRSKREWFPMVPVAIVLAVLSFLIAMGYGELATAARA